MGLGATYDVHLRLIGKRELLKWRRPSGRLWHSWILQIKLTDDPVPINQLPNALFLLSVCTGNTACINYAEVYSACSVYYVVSI